MDIFDYDNVLLLPRKCRVESRSECDPAAELGGRSFKLPVVPANMKTVVDEPITEWLAANGYFYVMHRFDLDNVTYARRMRELGLYVSISSGVKPADYAVIDRLHAEGVGADYITIAAPKRTLLAMSPWSRIPPSAMMGLVATRAHHFSADSCQPPVPKPVFSRVMQTLPGPTPTLVASAPQFSRSITASGVATLPAITKLSGRRVLMCSIILRTLSAWPCAMSIVM